MYTCVQTVCRYCRQLYVEFNAYVGDMIHRRCIYGDFYNPFFVLTFYMCKHVMTILLYISALTLAVIASYFCYLCGE